MIHLAKLKLLARKLNFSCFNLMQQKFFSFSIATSTSLFSFSTSKDKFIYTVCSRHH